MESLTPPTFKEEEIKQIVLKNYSVSVVKIKRLVSYIDLNFLIYGASGEKHVLKIAHKEQDPAHIEAQHLMFKVLGKDSQISDLFPRIVLDKEGKEIINILGKDGAPYLTRLLTFVEGECFANVPSSLDLLRNTGHFLGRMNQCLQGVNHLALRAWDSEWDLKNALYIKDYLSYVSNPDKRRLADYFILQFETLVFPKLRHLRQSAIHGDANDYNLLVKNGKISGLIDFGDVCYTPLINELAISLAYLLQHQEDVLQSSAVLIKAYHQEFPLKEEELELLYYLIGGRIFTSVVMAAYSRAQDPDNEYISISEKPGWALLYKLHAINPVQFEHTIKKACGFDFPSKESYEEELQARHRHISPALSVSYHSPLKITKGSLQYLYDDKGNTFLDGVNNICHVGHCHPKVVRAAQRQIALLNTNTRYLYDSLHEYAERLSATLPDALDTVFFVNSGSEATELALRIARTHTGHEDIFVADGAYHGNTSNCISISPYKFEGKGGFAQRPWVHKVPVPDAYRGRHEAVGEHWRKIGSQALFPTLGALYGAEVGRIVKEVHQKERKIAAFFCESLLGCGGQLVLPEGYLKEVYRHIRQAGGLCVADEVQVGFGRVGHQYWGFETQGVVPDIVVLGKPIGNGHPMAAVVTKKSIAASFNNGMEYFSSFGGNPVSCEVGKAVLEVIETESLQANALKMGNLLLNEWNLLKDKHTLIGDVRGMGLFLGLELVRNHETLEPADVEASKVVEMMKNRGILLSTDGPLHNVIKFKPPMVINEKNVAQIVDSLDRVFKDFK